MNFTIYKYDIILHFRARHNWSYFKIHYSFEGRNYIKSRFKSLVEGIKNGYLHLVWGKLSLQIEDHTIERYSVCAQCGSPDAHEVSIGDEGLTVCPDCRSIEGGYDYVNKRQYEALE